MQPYVELLAATNFSFLRGASHPFEMVAQAAGIGLSGIGICDRNSLSGVVRAFSAFKELQNRVPEPYQADDVFDWIKQIAASGGAAQVDQRIYMPLSVLHASVEGGYPAPGARAVPMCQSLVNSDLRCSV